MLGIGFPGVARFSRELRASGPVDQAKLLKMRLFRPFGGHLENLTAKFTRSPGMGGSKLPTHVQVVLIFLGIAACVHGIGHYGWCFIFRMIFSTDL